MMGAASMDLKSWGSSDPSLEAKAVAKGVADSNAVSKVLAFRWDRKEDSLRLPPLVLASFYKDGATKRDVLRGIATVYDPMGWYSPLTTPAKLIIQELWWRNLGWDDPIPSDLFEWWKSVATALENVQMTLPRSYLGSSSAVHDVHVFVDSSKRAYGAWAGAVHNGSSAFIMSKAKVAPLKVLGRGQPTIPLLELFAASLGVDMASTLIRVFQSNGVKVKITFWSDNQAVLYQIHRTEKHKCQIVNSRTNTIRAFNEQHNAVWRWVPTDSNPADLLTRGLTFEQFQSSDLWKYGPKWLTDPEAHPKWDVSQQSSLAVQFLQSVPVAPPVVEEPETNISVVINPMHYKWTVLLRVTAIVTRLCKILKAKVEQRRRTQQQQAAAGPPTAETTVVQQLLAAEVLWIRSEQAKFLKTELEYLRTRSGSRPSLVSQCDLFLDNDGIIRCGGRLRFSHLNQNTRHPIFIPKESPLAHLIIRAYHERYFHAGTGNTVNAIRQRYWITCAVQTVKVALRSCTFCRREEGPPFVGPDHAPLPDFRTKLSLPFTATGVDYTAPIIIRGEKEDEKAYIALYTCAASRGVHLEAARDATAKEFIQTFRRFASHHSLPKIVITDHGTNLVAGNRLIQRLLDSKEVRAYLNDLFIEVVTIPVAAPWQGGFYERLIGVTKSALMKAIGRTKMTFEELRTLVAEVEAIVNDRPLTKVSSNVNEKDALTPSHLMYGRRLTILPYDQTADVIEDPDYVHTPARILADFTRQAKVMAAFQKIFHHDYLVSLREHHQVTKGRYKQIIQVGDVVLIDNDGPRIAWPMAIVEKLIVSKDHLF